MIIVEDYFICLSYIFQDINLFRNSDTNSNSKLKYFKILTYLKPFF
jgi:hypothetical protein